MWPLLNQADLAAFLEPESGPDSTAPPQQRRGLSDTSTFFSASTVKGRLRRLLLAVLVECAKRVHVRDDHLRHLPPMRVGLQHSLRFLRSKSERN